MHESMYVFFFMFNRKYYIANARICIVAANFIRVDTIRDYDEIIPIEIQNTEFNNLIQVND